jgi:hypothetical protein
MLFQVKLSNFQRLQPTFRALNLRFDSHTANQLMTEEPGVAMTLLAQIKVVLDMPPGNIYNTRMCTRTYIYIYALRIYVQLQPHISHPLNVHVHAHACAHVHLHACVCVCVCVCVLMHNSCAHVYWHGLLRTCTNFEYDFGVCMLWANLKTPVHMCTCISACAYNECWLISHRKHLENFNRQK